MVIVSLVIPLWSFPVGSGMKNPPASSAETGLIPRWRRSSGGDGWVASPTQWT